MERAELTIRDNKYHCKTCGAECPINNIDKQLKTQPSKTWRSLHSSPPHDLE